MPEEASPPKTKSAYRVLADELRNGILAKSFPLGRLPPELELAKSHGLSRQTVRRAMQELVAGGLVYRVPGSGTFVAEGRNMFVRPLGSVEDLMGLSIDTEFEILDPLRRKVDVAAAGRLNLEDDVVWSVRFRRTHDEVPFCISTVHLPPDIARLVSEIPELTETGRRSRTTVIAYLDDRLEVPIGDADQSITVTAASSLTAAQLGCDPQHPLLRIERTFRDESGRIIELAVSDFLPEHYSYRIRLQRH